MNSGAFEPGDTLVVIDEDAERRALLAGQLVGPRRRVLTSSTWEALSLLSSTGADVAVAAIRTRSGAGFELLRKMRSSAADVEAIVVTDAADDSLVLDCLRHGAVDVLQMPRDAGRLQLTVELALERRRLVETEALYQASRLLLDAGPAERVAATVSELLRSAVAADEAILCVRNAAGELEALAHAQPEPDPVLCVLAERAADRAAPWVLGPAECGGGPFRHRMLLPLRSGAKGIGVIAIGRRDPLRPFRSRDLHKAAVLAAQAQLALENARLTAQLVRAERLAAMGELVAGVAHEINNPMSFVRSNLAFVSQALAAVRPPPGEEIADLQEALHDAEQGLDRIVTLIHDLRMLGRVEQMALSPVNLQDAVMGAVRVAGAELKRCKLVVNVPPDLAARSDPGRLGQVLVNLLLNAAHALGDQPADKRMVAIRAREENATCVLEIADSGPGVPAELRERIFEPFFSTKPQGRGTGLGLTLARRIIEGQGGTVTLLPPTGEGATFEIRLPRDDRRGA
jgi:signal transduction histidine kinase/DNA-binding NarL/FixJ family response regulator